MVQGYHTLLEAAQFLGMPPDELKQMAQRNQIRSFQDRGTLRFRIQDVQELARRRGAMSDPELVLGEAPPATQPRSAASPRPQTPRTPPKVQAPDDAPDVFDFDLGASDQVDIGQELFAKIEQPSSRKSGLGRPKTPPSPAKNAGSDSDVKLVADGEDFSVQLGSDSDVKLVTGDSDVKLAPPPGLQSLPSGRSSKLGKSKLGSSSPSKLGSSGPSKLGSSSPSKLGSSSPSKLGPITPAPPKSPSRLGADSAPQKRASRLGPQPADSGVRLVPMDSDSDVRIVGAGSDEVQLGEAPPPSVSDSDIRLERVSHAGSPRPEAMMLTEEINLDEEIRRQEAALKQAPTPSKVRAKSNLHFPTASPFELSDAELDRPSSLPADSKADSSDFDLAAAPPAVRDDSSDFDVQPMEESSDFSIELPADDQVMGGHAPASNMPSSGISLQNPVDGGIALEPGADDSVDFDLSLETEATPKPVQAADSSGLDSDSEFELSLSDSGQGQVASAEDSEFELTLDDSGQLAAFDSEPAAAPEESAGDQDIFETDFEVPGLDDSREAKLDTDLDSSDFDIALDDSDLAVEDESGSQVVALDEEAADEAAETVQGEDIEIEVEEDDAAGFGDLDGGEEAVVEVEEEVDETGPVREKIVEKMIEPAPWGAMPVVFMLPCVIVMVLVGLMGFELIQSSTGYKQAGFITRTFGELLGQKVK